MIKNKEIQQLLGMALEQGADFAELFLEDRDDLSLSYSNRLDTVSTMRTFGAGIYLIAGCRGMYACTNDIRFQSLRGTMNGALKLLASNGYRTTEPGTVSAGTDRVAAPCTVGVLPSTVEIPEKLKILREADSAARSISTTLRSIHITYFDRDQRIRVINSDGTDVEDRRVSTRLRFIPCIMDDRGMVSYFSDYVAAAGFEAVRDAAYIPGLHSVLRDMEDSLSADEAPNARVPVILEGGSCTGTFFHEACGHQLETTELRRNGLFWDKRGSLVASEKVTLVDDGTLPGMYGSSKYDDEGVPRQKNILIEKGVLKGFLVDRLGALQLGLPMTGSGRRQDYMHAPGARMSNTYLAPGDDDDEAIISDTEEGLYVTGIGGGSGGREFTLMAQSAYWIKNGKIGRRIKGAMLVGRGDETMLGIDRVGRELVHEQGGGSFCGADSGFCPTTTSGPRIRIARMLVGGKGGSR